MSFYAGQRGSMSWLDYSGCTKHGQLVSETQQRISKLQDAIANIQAVRKHLKRNAVEVCNMSPLLGTDTVPH